MVAEEKLLFPLLVTTLGVVLAVYVVKKWTRKPGSVPGPMGWPVVGYMPYLAPNSLYSTMEYLIKKYGPIFKLRLGSVETVVITDYDLIKKAFRSQEFSYRPNLFFFEFASDGFHGLASSSGELWIEQRRFALRHLRDLGMGKSSIGTHIEHEALCMVDLLGKSVGEPVDLNNSLNIAVTNIIWAIVAGRRMEYDDPLFLYFMAAIKRNVETVTKMGLVGFIPWLKDVLPRSWTGVNLVEESVENVRIYFKDIVAAHKESFDVNDMRDFTDYFIDEQMRQGEKSTFTDKQLMASMGDLFVAGGETTATTLRWAVLLLSYYPDAQQQMQAEIDSVIGKDRRPTLEDREIMPYTDAVIHEVQRFADIAPMGLFHAGIDDCQFEGYTIPKNALVMGYVGDIHRNKKYWAKPYEFYPEHFLDDNGLLRKNVEGYLPFSTGRRQCLGENLARAELFIFITYFFQNFKFTLSQEPKPSLDVNPHAGLVRWPCDYKVILESRSIQG